MFQEVNQEALNGVLDYGINGLSSISVECVNDIFENLDYLVMELLKQVNNPSDEIKRRIVEVIQNLFQSLDENLVEVENKVIYKLVLPRALDIALNIFGCSSLDNSTYQLALEPLLTIADVKPTIVRKYPRFVQCILPIVLYRMTSIRDIPHWYTSQPEEDDDPVFDDAAMVLDRIALSLGGKYMFSEYMTLIPELLKADEWQKRHTGLFTISSVAEGCKEFFEVHLDSIVSLVVARLADSHPRVRFAACNAIGQMCTDFAPLIQKKYHEQIMPKLVPIVDEDTFQRVQCHAAAAIVNFVEDSDQETISKYCNQIFQSLINILKRRGQIERYLLEQAITTIAAASFEHTLNKFSYYDEIMPILIEILSTTDATDSEFSKLRGKVIECMGIFATVVEKSTLKPHIKQIIDLFLKTATIVNSSDDQFSYVQISFARICRCAKDEIALFLEDVVPALFRTDEEEISQSTFTALGIFAKELGKQFAPYAETLLVVSISQLCLGYNTEDICGCVVELFSCVTKFGE
ncbi:hypothetical protein HK096_005040, partial [Nowakowskiella sp. JEL0078]